MLPVARANGVSHFEPVPTGNTVAGQSGLVAISGWTSEQMAIKKPIALHVFWPSANLQTNPRERGRTRERPKPLEEQAKEYREKIKALTEFFEEARAYVKARDAAKNGAPDAGKVPAWESMIAVVRGEIPVVVHADDVREIRAAVNWADTNHFKIIIADGRDSAKAAALLAEKKIPVIYDQVFTQPPQDSENYDVQFSTPGVLHKAGVKVIFSPGLGSESLVKNLPYHAAQAVAFGLPADEALKGITLYPAQIAGVADKLGSIEAGKEATLVVTDGDILDIRSNVKRMWIVGKEVSLESRHTRLYEKYKNRPVTRKE
jgi:imidazolonepropionase-like amidohydrolase